VPSVIAMGMRSMMMPTVGVAVDGTVVGHGSPRLIRWDGCSAFPSWEGQAAPRIGLSAAAH
jgi:hypothetical protein